MKKLLLNQYEYLRINSRRYGIYLLNALKGVKRLNIGGGPNFFGLGWMNLDFVESIGTKKILFQPDTILPYPDKSIKLVYSSHCFEHLDDPTVDRLLSESYRVLEENGEILIKIPDFDQISREFKNRNLDFLKNLGQNSVFWTWDNFGVVINEENCYSMLICGYWNKSYGDHFSGNINKNNTKAYHGPARVEQGELENILSAEDIREISKKLNSHVLLDKDFKQFNHQNAWTFEQFARMLKDRGFTISVNSKQDILTQYQDIPDINSMAEWSMFISAKK